jgi:hypothetical protein
MNTKNAGTPPGATPATPAQISRVCYYVSVAFELEMLFLSQRLPVQSVIGYSNKEYRFRVSSEQKTPDQRQVATAMDAINDIISRPVSGRDYADVFPVRTEVVVDTNDTYSATGSVYTQVDTVVSHTSDTEDDDVDLLDVVSLVENST